MLASLFRHDGMVAGIVSSLVVIGSVVLTYQEKLTQFMAELASEEHMSGLAAPKAE